MSARLFISCLAKLEVFQTYGQGGVVVPPPPARWARPSNLDFGELSSTPLEPL